MEPLSILQERATLYLTTTRRGEAGFAEFSAVRQAQVLFSALSATAIASSSKPGRKKKVLTLGER